MARAEVLAAGLDLKIQDGIIYDFCILLVVFGGFILILQLLTFNLLEPICHIRAGLVIYTLLAHLGRLFELENVFHQACLFQQVYQLAVGASAHGVQVVTESSFEKNGLLLNDSDGLPELL